MVAFLLPMRVGIVADTASVYTTTAKTLLKTH